MLKLWNGTVKPVVAKSKADSAKSKEATLMTSSMSPTRAICRGKSERSTCAKSNIDSKSSDQEKLLAKKEGSGSVASNTKRLNPKEAEQNIERDKSTLAEL